MADNGGTQFFRSAAELERARDRFLARAREERDEGAAFMLAPTEAHAGGSARGWRFDFSVAFSKTSFLLTRDGDWAVAVRTGPASFGWGVLGEPELSRVLDPFSTQLARALRQAPGPR